MRDDIDAYIGEYVGSLRKLLDELPREPLIAAFEMLWAAYRQDKQIFFCGNGGSAASSSHSAQDLAKGSMGRKGDLPVKAVRAIALTNDIGQITAWANDVSYEYIFAGQLKILMNPGDVLIGISGSGNSPNVLRALTFAKERGGRTIALVAFDGGKMRQLADIVVHIPSTHYGQLEDVHMSIGHMMAYWMQKRILEEQHQREA